MATAASSSTLACAFAEEGTYTASVTITDVGGSSTTTTATIVVNDAALEANAAPSTFTEGTQGTVLVASFTDDDPNAATSDYTASIVWGDDQTSLGTIASNGVGGFTVTGTNTYAEEGTYGVTVTITDVGGSTVTVNSTAKVNDAPLAASGLTIQATEGLSFSGTVATFTDADPNGAVGDYTATIRWGDGTSTTSGSIAADAVSGFDVNGTHTYADLGTYTITVTITDGSGESTVTHSTATAKSTADVSDADLNATGTTITPVEGASFTGVVATFTDANPGNHTGDFSGTITWGDGSTTNFGDFLKVSERDTERRGQLTAGFVAPAAGQQGDAQLQ